MRPDTLNEITCVMEAHRIENAKGERFARRVLGGGDGEPGWRE